MPHQRSWITVRAVYLAATDAVAGCWAGLLRFGWFGSVVLEPLSMNRLALVGRDALDHAALQVADAHAIVLVDALEPAGLLLAGAHELLHVRRGQRWRFLLSVLLVQRRLH